MLFFIRRVLVAWTNELSTGLASNPFYTQMFQVYM